MNIVKKFGVDFFSKEGALTLRTKEVTDKEVEEYDVPYQKTHEDGWTIKEVVHEDWFEWVNYFEASHPIYRKVWGDFEKEVFADSEDGFEHFYSNHTPKDWDYGDI